MLLAAAGVVGTLLCLLSLPGADVNDLGQFGLIPALPLTWYLGLVVLLGGSLAAGLVPRVPWWLAAGQLVALVLVLYGTVPLLSATPRYTWSYKHLGVTRFIEVFGVVDPQIDIYHRWPGFFALAALYGTLAGRPEPTSYASFCGPLFVLVQTLLVVAIAREVHRDRSKAWLAGSLFSVINWVGQDYFAPQPLALALGLGVLWIVLREFGEEPGPRRMALLARLTRTPPSRAVDPPPLVPPASRQWRRGAALVVVVVLFAAIVPSHQLTPYLVVITISVLTVTGFVRPWWLPLVLGATAVAYLIPNLDYILNTFGIFSGFDVFNNAHPSVPNEHSLPGKVLAARAGESLSAVLFLSGLGGLVLAWRRGIRVLLVATACMLAPVLLLFGQSYGGEGALRVILFSAPWAAILITGWVLGTARRRSVVAFSTLAVVMTALFLPAYFGQEELNIVPASEVQAAEYLYENGVSGSVVLLSAPGFPIRLNERYPLFAGPLSDKDPNFLADESRQRRPLGPSDVPAVVDQIRQYSDRGYVVFSKTQESFATTYGVSSTTDLRELERALLESGRFRVFYQNDTTRIYELLK